jgi:hypothetical protein
MRRSRWIAAAAVGVFALVGLARPIPVRAECPWFPVPPATDAARSAREVIVGTVIENIRDNPEDFRLRVDHVLRGSAQPGEVRRIKALYPGWPFARAEGGKLWPPCAPIPGWKGDVIAFSFDALAPDGKTRYNAASWISGYIPPYRRDDLSRTTLAEMRALASLPPTDTVSVPSASKAPVLPVAPAAASLGVFTFVVAMTLLRRRRPPRPA